MRSLVAAACFLCALACTGEASAQEGAEPETIESPASGAAAEGAEGTDDATPRERRRSRRSKGARERASSELASSGRTSKRASETARERSPRPPRKKSAYDLLKESWHVPAPDRMCADFRKATVPDLVFLVQGKNTSYVLRPKTRQGGFDETQLAIAKEAFGSWDTGPTPHARTLDLVYAATLHFGAPYVHLISGVRRDRTGSRHSHGLAADVVLPGVDDEELAAFFRAQGFVGVGTYPRSGFVHVDTRDQSYFWIDYSSPGRRGKITTVRADEAKLVDEAALVRGSNGFVNPPRLQKALNARASRRRAAHRPRDGSQSAAAATAQTGPEP